MARPLHVFPRLRRVKTGHPPSFLADCDKVMLLAVSWADGYRVTAREFDVRTQQWSPSVSRSAPQLAKLVDGAAAAASRHSRRWPALVRWMASGPSCGCKRPHSCRAIASRAGQRGDAFRPSCGAKPSPVSPPPS